MWLFNKEKITFNTEAAIAAVERNNPHVACPECGIVWDKGRMKSAWHLVFRGETREPHSFHIYTMSICEGNDNPRVIWHKLCPTCYAEKVDPQTGAFKTTLADLDDRRKPEKKGKK